VKKNLRSSNGLSALENTEGKKNLRKSKESYNNTKTPASKLNNFITHKHSYMHQILDNKNKKKIILN